MKIVGANGIRTHGAGNIDRLLLELRIRGFETRDIHFLKAHTWHVRRRAEGDGKILAQASNDGDIVVCHSYGALRTFYAHQHRNYKAIVCIAPAMEKDEHWRRPELVHCFYSPDDWVITLGSWIPFHPFGPAGNEGFSQPGVVNRRVEGAGHNDFFYGKRLQRICDYIAKLAGTSTRTGSPKLSVI